jgi:hypothetical protein
MQRIFVWTLAIVLAVTAASYGQSLGDVARANREKKAETVSAAPVKVITNQNLPKDPDANQEPSEASPVASTAAGSNDADRLSAHHLADQRRAEHRSAAQRLAQQRAAEQWKRQILAQKNKMATLQARIDQINASIRSANGSAQYEGPANGYQARQMQQVAQIQLRLDEQHRKLDQMQEAARRAGMHTAVYDP